MLLFFFDVRHHWNKGYSRAEADPRTVVGNARTGSAKTSEELGFIWWFFSHLFFNQLPCLRFTGFDSFFTACSKVSFVAVHSDLFLFVSHEMKWMMGEKEWSNIIWHIRHTSTCVFCQLFSLLMYISCWTMCAKGPAWELVRYFYLLNIVTNIIFVLFLLLFNS